MGSYSSDPDQLHEDQRPFEMHNEQGDPILAQVPLTVSPFVSLPTATTLPYTYKSLPSTLPPSSSGADVVPGQDAARAKFILSSSGHSAHPDDIISSCQSLQAHLQKQQDDARKLLAEWEDDMREKELAKKRRLAPGWLDSDAKLLQPERAKVVETPGEPARPVSLLDAPVGLSSKPTEGSGDDDAAGRALDQAFGGMGLGKAA